MNKEIKPDDIYQLPGGICSACGTRSPKCKVIDILKKSEIVRFYCLVCEAASICGVILFTKEFIKIKDNNKKAFKGWKIHK